MTKKQEHSITMIQRTLETLEEALNKELTRESAQRRKHISKAFGTLQLHFGNLGVELGGMEQRVFYSPASNLKDYQVYVKAFEEIRFGLERKKMFKAIVKKAISSPIRCKFCGKPAKYQDRTWQGTWEYMCRKCHAVRGVGIGYELILVIDG